MAGLCGIDIDHIRAMLYATPLWGVNLHPPTLCILKVIVTYIFIQLQWVKHWSRKWRPSVMRPETCLSAEWKEENRRKIRRDWNVLSKSLQRAPRFTIEKSSEIFCCRVTMISESLLTIIKKCIKMLDASTHCVYLCSTSQGNIQYCECYCAFVHLSIKLITCLKWFLSVNCLCILITVF